MFRIIGFLALTIFLKGCAAELPVTKPLLSFKQSDAPSESSEGSGAEAGSDASGVSPSAPGSADVPVPTGGTFLVCQEDLSLGAGPNETAVGCRLQDKNGVKLASIAELKPQFSVARANGQPLSDAERAQVQVAEQKSVASPWHWEVRYASALAPLVFNVRITHPNGTEEVLAPASPSSSLWQAKPGVELNMQPLQFSQGGFANGTTSLPNSSDLFLIPNSAPIQLVGGQVQKALLRMTFRNGGTSLGACEYGSEKNTDKVTVLTCSSGLLAGKDIRITAIDTSLAMRPLPTGVADDGVALQFRLLGHSVPAVERKP